MRVADPILARVNEKTSLLKRPFEILSVCVIVASSSTSSKLVCPFHVRPPQRGRLYRQIAPKCSNEAGAF